jgi:putative endonuclease
MDAPRQPRRTRRRRRGDHGEEVAARHLEGSGWAIVARAVSVGRYELDIVAVDPSDGGTLVFVEVRGRSTRRFGPAEASVDAAKVLRTYRAALALVAARELPDGQPLPDLPWRVDLIAADLDPWIGPGAGGPRIRHIRGLAPP